MDTQMASRRDSDLRDVTRFSGSFKADLDRSANKLLTYLLEEKYRLNNVMIVKGTKRDACEQHFWVG